jgi:monothiol glutaredoxin
MELDFIRSFKTYVYSENFFSGFSNKACEVLKSLHTPFETVNVLESPALRSAIKEYSKWPTIPQLYVGGEFVGGSDIMQEMLLSGELAELI